MAWGRSMEMTMSVHDRARRREQRHQRSAGVASRQPAPITPVVDEADTEAAEIVNLSRSAPAAALPAASSVAAANNPRPVRRGARPAPAPVDYSADYRAARTDLRWIALWAGLLFIAMIALRFSGLV